MEGGQFGYTLQLLNSLAGFFFFLGEVELIWQKNFIEQWLRWRLKISNYP
jgi:hypothetical protein